MSGTDFTLLRAAREALREGNAHAALRHLDEFIENTPALKEKTAKERLDEAHALLRADYYDDVDRAAEEIATHWRSGDYDGMDSAVDEAVDESADGRFLNDADALLCLLFSNNDQAYKDTTDDLTDWSTAAYYAFRQDVREALADKIDLSQSPPNMGDKQCSECSEYRPGDEFDLTMCADCSEENGNLRCKECETWNIAEEITDGICEDCREANLRQDVVVK